MWELLLLLLLLLLLAEEDDDEDDEDMICSGCADFVVWKWLYQ